MSIHRLGAGDTYEHPHDGYGAKVVVNHGPDVIHYTFPTGAGNLKEGDSEEFDGPATFVHEKGDDGANISITEATARVEGGSVQAVLESLLKALARQGIIDDRSDLKGSSKK